MGIFTKNNHGIEYLYALAGKSQFFLGRKDEPDNLNLNNLRKSTKIIDQNFDKMLEKYLEDVKEHSSYMPGPERKEYLSKRSAELLARLRRLEEGVPTTKVRSKLITKLTNPILNQVMSRVAHSGFRLAQKKNLEELLKDIDQDLKNDKT